MRVIICASWPIENRGLDQKDIIYLQYPSEHEPKFFYTSNCTIYQHCSIYSTIYNIVFNRWCWSACKLFVWYDVCFIVMLGMMCSNINFTYAIWYDVMLYSHTSTTSHANIHMQALSGVWRLTSLDNDGEYYICRFAECMQWI